MRLLVGLVARSRQPNCVAQVRTSHFALTRGGFQAPNAARAPVTAHERVRGLIDTGAAYRHQAAAAAAGFPQTLNPASVALTPCLPPAGPLADAVCRVGAQGGRAHALALAVDPDGKDGVCGEDPGPGGPSKPAAGDPEAQGMASQAAAWAGVQGLGCRAAAERRADGVPGGGFSGSGSGEGNPYGPNGAWMASEIARRSPAYSPSDAGRRRAIPLRRRMLTCAGASHVRLCMYCGAFDQSTSRWSPPAPQCSAGSPSDANCMRADVLLLARKQYQGSAQERL